MSPLFPEFNYSHRNAIATAATGPSKVAFSTEPLDKSQHCPQFPTRGDGNLVLPGWYLRRMEVNIFSPVDPREAYALVSLHYTTL
jgi:hypothetical protein